MDGGSVDALAHGCWGDLTTPSQVRRHMSTVVALSSIPLDWTLGTLITLVVMQLPVLFWVWLTQSKYE
jgi:hypothetical protein